MDRTPYSDGIDQIDNFFDDVKDSELAKKGTRDFAEAFVKAQVLPHHLEEMGRLSYEQNQREELIAKNIELV